MSVSSTKLPIRPSQQIQTTADKVLCCHRLKNQWWCQEVGPVLSVPNFYGVGTESFQCRYKLLDKIRFKIKCTSSFAEIRFESLFWSNWFCVDNSDSNWSAEYPNICINVLLQNQNRKFGADLLLNLADSISDLKRALSNASNFSLRDSHSASQLCLSFSWISVGTILVSASNSKTS